MIIGEISVAELTNVAMAAFEQKMGRPMEQKEYAALLYALGCAFQAIAEFQEGTHQPTIGAKQ